MSNIGRKVRIKGYTDDAQTQYNGQIGEITGDSLTSIFFVELPSGHVIVPYRPDDRNAQCEFLEEYTVEDFQKKQLAIHSPTQEIWNKVVDILKVSGLFGKLISDEKMWYKYFPKYEKNCLSAMYGLGYADLDFHKATKGYTIIKGEDFIIHNEHLLTTKKETMSTEKPIPFIINGKEHQIAAIMVDLITEGYKECLSNKQNKEKTNIINNSSNTSILEGFPDKYSEETFKELYASKDKWDNLHLYKIFNLPEQYSEALEFAKKQINHPYWTSKPESKTITIGNNNVEITVKKDGDIVFNAEGVNHTTKIYVVRQFTQYSKSSQNIAGYEVNIAHEVRFIRIGCIKENNLFSINDIQRIIDTYDELNK